MELVTGFEFVYAVSVWQVFYFIYLNLANFTAFI